MSTIKFYYKYSYASTFYMGVFKNTRNDEAETEGGEEFTDVS